MADMVKLLTANSPFEAKMIKAVLEGADIPCHVPGQELQDEFAMTQKLLGAVAVDVYVARDSVEDAHRALAEAKEAGESAAEDDDEDDEDDDGDPDDA